MMLVIFTKMQIVMVFMPSPRLTALFVSVRTPLRCNSTPPHTSPLSNAPTAPLSHHVRQTYHTRFLHPMYPNCKTEPMRFSDLVNSTANYSHQHKTIIIMIIVMQISSLAQCSNSTSVTELIVVIAEVYQMMYVKSFNTNSIQRTSITVMINLSKFQLLVVINKYNMLKQMKRITLRVIQQMHVMVKTMKLTMCLHFSTMMTKVSKCK